MGITVPEGDLDSSSRNIGVNIGYEYWGQAFFGSEVTLPAKNVSLTDAISLS
jgi:hypothetical protein